MYDPFLNLHALSGVQNNKCQYTNKLVMELLLTACMTFLSFFFPFCAVSEKKLESACELFSLHLKPRKLHTHRLITYEGLTFELQNILKFVLNSVKEC